MGGEQVGGRIPDHSSPSSEIEAARRHGLIGIIGSAETWETDERFDVVMLCHTIEHLYDLRATMAKARRYLTRGGLFYCDCLDYMELCRMTGDCIPPDPDHARRKPLARWTTATG